MSITSKDSIPLKNPLLPRAGGALLGTGLGHAPAHEVQLATVEQLPLDFLAGLQPDSFGQCGGHVHVQSRSLFL